MHLDVDYDLSGVLLTLKQFVTFYLPTLPPWTILNESIMNKGPITEIFTEDTRTFLFDLCDYISM